jgi:hypothetical protein
MAFDARWQEVTCRCCKRTYTCTPEDDYYGPGEDKAAGPQDGVCFKCLLVEGGYDPETTPVLAIDETGAELDPRRLALRPQDGAA